MAALLPGAVVLAVSAAAPPRADGGRPPSGLRRPKAALTLFGDPGVFRLPTNGRNCPLRFLRGTHRNYVLGARQS